MRITIDRLVTILITVGEEDTCLGFEQDQEVQEALNVLHAKIDEQISQGLSLGDCLITFE